MLSDATIFHYWGEGAGNNKFLAQNKHGKKHLYRELPVDLFYFQNRVCLISKCFQAQVIFQVFAIKGMEPKWLQWLSMHMYL